LIDDGRWDAFNRKRDAVARESERLRTTWVNPAPWSALSPKKSSGQPIEREYSLLDLLVRPT
jgi:tRNA uridine 5-carboxymethylaminomethyl modification enzyme